ncbi:MAG: hypothetical protein ABI473_05295 [Candidatus Dormibacter sp.]
MTGVNDNDEEKFAHLIGAQGAQYVVRLIRLVPIVAFGVIFIAVPCYAWALVSGAPAAWALCVLCTLAMLAGLGSLGWLQHRIHVASQMFFASQGLRLSVGAYYRPEDMERAIDKAKIRMTDPS